MINQQTLIVGANSGIAKEIAIQALQNPSTSLILVSRALNDFTAPDQNMNKRITTIILKDYQSKAIKACVQKIAQQSDIPITQIFICHGVLHSETIKPEKRLEDFSAEVFQEVIAINTLTPMLWIQQLVPILSSKKTTKIVVFNARVGSISENQLGGWYSYRTSKAALNMLLKTLAIELARRSPNIKLISFHPGTTDTPLSKPYQKNVPIKKLFTSNFVAHQLLNIIEDIEVDGKTSYIDWQGKTINW
jgi:NAD(P)-dependent dehydrogenase (short-subunit alcohol dehydrogenase family)